MQRPEAMRGAEWLDRITGDAPVYDQHGEKLGIVEATDPQQGTFLLRRGIILPRDVPIPLHAVREVDASGAVYLNMTHSEVERHVTGGWSNLGERDLITGVPADADVGSVPSFPDGNNAAGMQTTPDLVSGLPSANDLLASAPPSSQPRTPTSAAPMGATSTSGTATTRPPARATNMPPTRPAGPTGPVDADPDIEVVPLDDEQPRLS